MTPGIAQSRAWKEACLLNRSGSTLYLKSNRLPQDISDPVRKRSRDWRYVSTARKHAIPRQWRTTVSGNHLYDSGGDDYPDGGQNMPIIATQQSDYNQGVAWTTTATPPAANVAGLERAGSLALQPDPVPDSPSPSQLPESSESVHGDRTNW
ncbi:hypothetical protein JB92DRAFT_2833176 [Gautieria morchelliformis]|nr:hypothetical protein JB92DRAFT_2833176 [Gautieria morchelliformis]